MGDLTAKEAKAPVAAKGGKARRGKTASVVARKTPTTRNIIQMFKLTEEQ
ncbi:hypothetical protein SOVF_110450 [Spinacia oleracea]|nr:hypothetical protein SOVF_110450 [Spinacia oleracea]